MITLDSDTSDCPGAVCKIVSEDGKDILVQQDWDAPGVASTFGWDMSEVQLLDEDDQPVHQNKCYHNHTDGTVDCHCGVTASQFISAAIDWINSNDGAEAEDPGYFDNEE